VLLPVRSVGRHGRWKDLRIDGGLCGWVQSDDASDGGRGTAAGGEVLERMSTRIVNEGCREVTAGGV